MGSPEIGRVVSRVGLELVGFLRENIGRTDLAREIGRSVTGDITRKIDLMAEEYLVDLVKASGVDAWVLSEERGLYKVSDKPEYLIIADPLDGSLNYVLEIPFSAVSIAVYSMSEPYYSKVIYGFVSNIFREERYEYYNGAIYLNGAEYKSSLKGRGIICIYTVNPRLLEKIRKFVLDKGGKPRLRTLGATSLEILYTAIGRMEYYINDVGGIRANDIAVGLGVALNKGLRVIVRPQLSRIDPTSINVFDEVWVTPSDYTL